MKLRADFGITLITIGRNEETILNPKPDTIITEGDLLYVMGTPFQISCALSLFENENEPECS